MNVTLRHTKTKGSKVVVEKRTHDMSQFTNWGQSEEFREVIESLEEPLGVYGHDIRRLSLEDRCRLVESMLDGDKEKLYWKAGYIGMPPERVEPLWEEFGDTNE